MAFPSPAVNGQTYTTGGYTYVYNSTFMTWTKTTTTSSTIGNVTLSNSNISTGNTTITSNSVTTNTISTGNVTVNTSNITAGNTTITSNTITTNTVSTGNVTVNDSNISTGNTTISGNTISTGNITINATTNTITTGNTTVSNTSITTNTVSTGNVTVNDSNISTGNTTITGNSITTGNVSITTSNISTGNTTISGNTISTGNITINATTNTITTGNTTVSNTSITTNTVSTGNVTVNDSNISTGNTTITGNSITTGNVSITTSNISTGNTTITGNSITTGNVTINTSNITTGNTTVTNTSITTNTVSTGNVTVNDSNISTGNTTITGNSITTGNVTINTSNITTGNTIVTNTSITTNTVSTGNVTVNDSNISTGNTTITGNSITTGNVTINSSNITTGNTTISNTAVTTNTVTTGNTTVSNTGLTTGNSSVTANAVTTVNVTSSNVTANGNIDFSGASNVTLGVVGNVHITGGTSGYVLKTDGLGNLSWVSPASAGVGGSNTQVQFNDDGSAAGDANFTYDKTTDTLSVKNVTLEGTGNLIGGNLISANYITGTMTTASQPNITQLGNLVNLNVDGNIVLATGNISGVNNFTATTITGTLATASQPNITSVGTLAGLTATNTVNLTSASNVSLGPVANIHITGGTTGYVLKTDGAGNLSWVSPASAGVGGSNTQVQFNDGGAVSGDANFTFDKTTDTLNIKNVVLEANGNLSGGNVVFANTFTSNVANGTAPLTVTSRTKVANLYVDRAALADTVGVTEQTTGTFYPTFISSNASGNYSLATNSSISVNIATSTVTLGPGSGGSITDANLVSANYVTASSTVTVGSGTGGNVTGANLVSANYFTGTLTTAAQPNITSIGTLSSLSVTANISSGNANLGNLATANYLTGTLTTAAQPNITSVGTLSSLTVTANISSGNANLGNLATANYLTGTLTTGNQPNITTTGTLTDLVVSGNLTIGGSTTYVNVTNTYIKDPIIDLGGGANGAALTTNDSKDRGTLLHYHNGTNAVDAFMGWDNSNAEFAFGSNVSVSSEVVTFNTFGNIRANNFIGNVTGTVSGTIAAPGSNTQILFNDAGNVNANSGLTFNKSTNNLTVSGNIITGGGSGGNISGVNYVTANYFVGNGALLTGVDVLAVGSANQADIANSIQVGNSTIKIPAANGNIVVAVTGTNVANFTNTGINVNGYVNASTTINATGNISTANYFVGNGYYLTGLGSASSVANGNSNVNVPSSNGNVTISVRGVTNVAVISNVGVNVAGYVTATGNVTGNYILGNGYYLTGVDQLSVGNAQQADVANSIQVGTSSIKIPVANGNIVMAVAATNIANVTTTGVAITGTLNTTGNVTVGSGTGGTFSGANLVSANFITGTLTSSAQAQPNITSVGTLASLIVGPNSSITLSGSTGYVLANAIYGKDGTAAMYPYYNSVAGSAAIRTDLQVGAASAGNIVANGNVTANNASLGNLVTANYFSGTVYTAAQPNITSLGTQNGLTSNGTVDFTGASNVSLGDVANLHITGGTNGYILTTDGSGGLSWAGAGAAIAGGAAGSNTYIQFNDGGSFGADADFNYDKSLDILNVKNISLPATGSVYGANLVSATYIQGNGEGMTGVAHATSNVYVARGTSNVNIPSTGGNINMSVAGTANVVVVTGTSATVAGNVTATNANLGNLVTANYFTGNGSLLTAVSAITVANGTSNVAVPSSGGNVTVSVAGNANIVTVTGTGANVTGYLGVSGNLTSGNANLGNLVVANYFSGNGSSLTAVSAINVANGNSNVNIPAANGNITLSVRGVSNVLVAANTGVTITGTLSTGTGNANVGNLGVTDVIATGNVTATSNVVANNFIGKFANGTSNIAIPAADGNITFSAAGSANVFVVTSSNIITGGNLVVGSGTGGNLINANVVSANLLTGTLTTAAQPNITSIGTLGNLTVTSNVTAGNVVGRLANGNSNVNIPASNGNVTISAVGNANIVTVTGTGVNVAGTLNVTGASMVSNLTANTTAVIDFSAASNINLGSLSNVHLSGGGLGYILQTDGSGTLSWVTPASGIAGAAAGQNKYVQFNDAGDFGADANFTYDKSNDTLYVVNVVQEAGSSLSGGNLVSANYVTGTLTTAAQPNITSLGTIASLSVTGNVSAGNVTATNFNGKLANGNSNVNIPASNGNVTISASGTANVIVVTSTGVNVSGTLNATGNANVGNLGATTIIASGNLSATNANLGNLVTANYFTGTLTTAAQPNITSLGTISSLTVSGNISVGNIFGVLANGNSNVSIPAANGNINFTAGGNSNVFVVTSSGAYTPGTITSEGNIITGTGGGGSITGANLVSANYITGTLTTAAQPNITSVGTLNSPSVSGLTGTGVINLTGASNVALGSNTNVHITGGTTGQYLQTDGSGGLSWATISTASTSNGTSNLSIPVADGNINLSVGGNANVFVTTGTGINVYGTLNATGNANVGNLGATNVIGTTVTATGNVSAANANLGNLATANYFAGVLTTQAQPNVTSLGTLAGLNVSGDTVITGNLTVTGSTEYTNVTSVNITDPIVEQGGGANGAALTSNDSKDRGTLLHYHNGTNPVDAFMGWDNSNAEFVFGSNVTIAGDVVTFNNLGNVRANYLFGNATYLTGVATAASSNTALTANTVTDNAQPNITSTGTLSGLTATGTVNLTGASNVSLGSNTNVHISGGTSGQYLQTDGSGGLSWVTLSPYSITNGTSNVSIPSSNGNVLIGVNGTANVVTVSNTGATISNLTVSGNITSAAGSGGNLSGLNYATANYFVGTLTTGAQPNITSLGTLSALSVSGNISATNANLGNLATANYVSGTLTTAIQSNITQIGTMQGIALAAGTNLSGGNLVSANYVTGTLTTAAQPNITSVGTMTGITIAGTGSVSGGNLVSANYVTGTLTTGAQGNITSVGTLAGLTANSTVNFTSASNVALGSNSNVHITGGSSGQYLQTNGSGGLSWASISTASTSNGTSNLSIPVADGNVNLSASGNANILVVTGTGVNVFGTFNSTGNANVGNLGANIVVANNINVSANVTAANFMGRLANGNSYVSIDDVNGNVYITANNVIDIVTVATTGTIVSGNLTAGNLFGTFIGQFGNGTSNVNIPIVNGDINFSAGGNANVFVINSEGANLVGNLVSTGNIYTGFSGNGSITGANLIESNYFHSTVATGSAPLIIESSTLVPNLFVEKASTAGTVYTAAQPNITSVGTLVSVTTTGNVSATNANLGNLVAANYFAGVLTTKSQPNITAVGTLAGLTANSTINFTAASNVSLGAVGNVHITGGLPGYILTTNGSGGLTWASASGAISGGAAGSNTYVQYNNGGDFGAEANFYYDQDTHTLGTKNLTLEGAGNITGGNLVSANYFTGTITTAAQPNITSLGTLSSLTVTANVTAGNVAGGNLVSANYFTGTLTTGAQPNITSTGTLSSLTVTANISSGNANLGNLVTANFFTGNGSLLTSITGANVTGTVANATYAVSAGTAGTVTTAAQPNITSVGTLSTLGVNGVVTATRFVSNIATGTAPLGVSSTTRVANLNVAYANVSDYSVVTAQTTGTFYPVLASGATTGNYAIAVNNAISLDVASSTLSVGGGSGGNITGANLVSANYFTGTLTTAAQPNITSVGTMNGLTANGTVNFTNASNVSLGAVGNLHISGGSANYILQTDGSGTLSWVSASTGIAGAASGSNTQIQFNDSGSFAGNANLTFDKSTKTLSVDNISSSNTISANYIHSLSTTGANFHIIGATQSTANGHGGNVLLVSGAADGTGTGGSLLLAAGDAASAGNGRGGATTIRGGTGYGQGLGGNIQIIAGDSGNTGGGYGAKIAVEGGDYLGAGGTALIKGGDGEGTNKVGGSTTIQGGGSTGNATPGKIILQTSTPTTSGSILQGMANRLVISETTADFSSNITASGNITASYFFGNGSLLTGIVASSGTATTVTSSAQPNITSVGTLSNLTVSGTITQTGNVDINGNLNVTGNVNYQNVTNMTIGDPLIYLGANNTGNLYELGIVASYNDGAYKHTGLARDHSDGVWKFFDGVVAEPSTTIDFANGTFSTVKVGNFTAVSNVNANLVTANFFTGNGSMLSSITGANVTGYVSNATHANIADVANSVAGANVTGQVANALVAGTVYTNAQPNITSVGTLTSLDVNGNVTVGSGTGGTFSGANLVSANFFTGNGSLLTSITGANVTGQVSYAAVANSVVGANVTGEVAFAAVANSVAGANVTGQVANALIAGTVYTNAQPNITSVGTLTSLTVTGNVTAGNIKSDHLLYANGSPYVFTTSASGSNTQVQFNDSTSFAGSTNFTFDKTTNTLSVTNGLIGNVKTDNLLYANGTPYVFTTNAAGSNTQIQFNDGNSFAGNAGLTFNKTTTTLTANNFVATSSIDLGAIGNVTITGGTSGQVLTTDGTGNLSWGSGGTTDLTVDTFTGNGVQTAFTLTSTPISENYTFVTIGGISQPRSTYSLSGTTLTMSSAVPNGAEIEITSITGGMGVGASITNDTSTNSDSYFPLMSTSSSGVWGAAYASNSKLYFNPSTGTLSATSFNSLSDRNKKTNLEPISDALAKVQQLTGYNFNYVDSNEPSAGVIAQDVEKVLPNVVKHNVEQDVKTVNYNGLTGLLIEAVKVLTERVEILENKLKGNR